MKKKKNISHKKKNFLKKKLNKIKYNKFYTESKKYNLYDFVTIPLKIIFFIFTIILIVLISRYNKYKQRFIDEYNIVSEKWIVMIAFNPPDKAIIDLERKIKDWKIVVMGTNKTNDSNWDIFKNSNKLIYLSIKEQNKLGYKILNYLDEDSYCRKNIGYLFAIKHGAKEIYEIDENLNFSGNLHFFDIDINNSYVCYGIQNNNTMINPYIHFGQTNIWPRGFLFRDINIDFNNSFYFAQAKQINLKPLIFQGLINEVPDVDSIFLLSNIKNKTDLNIKFSKNYPLLYLPGNYIPINAKNTKFLYELFPFLMLPLTVDETISDIIRGYIIERFTYEYGGTIIFHNTNAYNKKTFFNNINIIKEKEIFFRLNEILDIIKSKKYPFKNPLKLLFDILSELIKNNLLERKEIEAYNAFLKDLSNIGYILPKSFSKIFDNNNNLNISSEFKYYIPANPNILKGNSKFKIMNHISSDKIYNDILLIINFNKPGFLTLNKYLEKLYKYNFPNIVYLYPEKIENEASNTIICEESSEGRYSYVCFDKIYNKYPNYKGYFFINDDDYIKVWELEKFDFNIPWFYQWDEEDINKNKKKRAFRVCKQLIDMCDNNFEWKKNVTNFYADYLIFKGFSDLYYIPNYYISNFVKISEVMYSKKLFLECAVPISFAILSAPKNQLIYCKALWSDAERKRVINFLYDDFQQFSIHPIKFSNNEYRYGVDKYIFFINANDF